ncbi:MAG: hypothetical protein NT090_00010 [Acidobacteria bacterium]|nr:hypothetical protein [Acidobacteriota bacterium]
MSLFDPVWESLAPREQARVVQLLVERVAYDGRDGQISVTFRPTGIKTLAAELAEVLPELVEGRMLHPPEFYRPPG